MQNCQVVQISDLHLSASGQSPAHGQVINPWDKLQSIIQDIRSLRLAPDLIVFSGDLIHNGQVADYQHFRRLTISLATEFNCPVKVVIGNHDIRQNFYRGYLTTDPGPFFCERLRLQNMDFYLLDSKFRQHAEAGYLSEAQLRWLGKHLRQAPTKRAFIFLHHPLDGPNLANMRYSILQNTPALLSVLRGHNIGGIFSGHLHFSCSYVNGANFLNVVAGSASYYIDCSRGHEHLIHEACSYQIIQINRGQVGVTTRQLLFNQAVIDEIQVKDSHFLSIS